MDAARSFVRFGAFLGVAVVASIFLSTTAQAASFNPSRLVDDVEFTNVNSMTADEVQRFLVQKGSFLANYSENGRLASQIIVDAAHGFGDGSGSINGITISPSTGTVNPAVLLVTLQKEQSLVTMTSQNDAALRTAMGYGCPDSGGCNPAYAGLTKQVENAAWQLRYNYERASGKGFSDYQVGQSSCFSNPSGGTDCVTFENRATSALYRYTPHVYNGNYNFWNLFTNTYNFSIANFAAQAITWSSSDGAFVYPTVYAGGVGTNFVFKIKNTGLATWQQGQVFLGTEDPRNRVPFFLRESGNGSPSGWEYENRVRMQESSVAPGEVATFNFWMQPTSGTGAGTYREAFRLVTSSGVWFGPDVWWTVTVR